ncbi:MAG TPA: hypothetical protein VFR00_12440 [Hyphomicrobiaceae bacterium]|jgi:hypothetical protein|nr:hypothetical protein [Hyphomicrobiaceae bacterium]
MLPAKPIAIFPLTVAVCALALAGTGPVAAKTRNTIGTIIGVGAAGALLNEAAKAMGQKPTRPGGPAAPGTSSSGETGKRNEDPDAAARAARQLAAIEENGEIERAKKMELERNVDLAIKAFIDKLIEWHNAINTGDRVRSTRGELNQVTAGQVKASIEEAYDKANLREFEKYSGELWTRDRLLVRIMRYATKNLRPYYEGVGAKGPSMDDLKDLFHRSAREAFAKALETGEIIGVSKSFDRFIRTIYENTDNGSENLTTRGMDGQYERLTSVAIDVVWRNDFAAGAASSADSESLDRQFLFRFRSRRALYDCLSLTYPELLHGSGGTTTAAFTSSSAAPSTERSRQSAAPRSLTLAEQEALAGKVRTHVANVCQGNVPTILAKAKSGNIGPVSSRESGLATGTIPAAERR